MKIRIRRILVPVFYVLSVACLIEIPLSETTLFGEEVILWDTLFRAILGMPVLWHFYREDEVFRSKERWNLKTALTALLTGAALSLLFHGIMTAVDISGKQAAEETLFVGRLWVQALVLLVASPLLEELFFRGVFYSRLKELVPVWAAVLISAAAFGLFHGNAAQGIYGFIMGIFLALFMEKTQTVKAPILFHFAANGAAFLLMLSNLP